MSVARASVLRTARVIPALPFRPLIRFQSTAAGEEYQYILTSTPKPGVGQSMQVVIS